MPCIAANRWTPMSSRKTLPVKLSPIARQDFVDILRYTGERWGQNQFVVLCSKIDDALQAIGTNALFSPLAFSRPFGRYPITKKDHHASSRLVGHQSLCCWSGGNPGVLRLRNPNLVRTSDRLGKPNYAGLEKSFPFCEFCHATRRVLQRNLRFL